MTDPFEPSAVATLKDAFRYIYVNGRSDEARELAERVLAAITEVEALYARQASRCPSEEPA